MTNNMNDEKKKFPTMEQAMDYIYDRWDGDCYSQDDLMDVVCDVYKFITKPLDD